MLTLRAGICEPPLLGKGPQRARSRSLSALLLSTHPVPLFQGKTSTPTGMTSTVPTMAAKWTPSVGTGGRLRAEYALSPPPPQVV
jgi:hypothetical protein